MIERRHRCWPIAAAGEQTRLAEPHGGVSRIQGGRLRQDGLRVIGQPTPFHGANGGKESIGPFRIRATLSITRERPHGGTLGSDAVP